MNLITYKDFFKVLWKTFSSLYIGCNCMDIVFDLYLEQSIKQSERSKRSKLEPIDTNISSNRQQLPVEMDRFWASSYNKMKFQQAFIDWITFHCQSNIPVFLGGANTENITSCIQISDGELIAVPSLKMTTKKQMIRWCITWINQLKTKALKKSSFLCWHRCFHMCCLSF